MEFYSGQPENPAASVRDYCTGVLMKTWRLEIEAFGSVEAKRRQQADAAELLRLRKDNKRLAEEVEILHKASAFFATRAVKP